LESSLFCPTFLQLVNVANRVNMKISFIVIVGRPKIAYNGRRYETLGSAGYVIINRYKSWCEAERSNNQLNPNVLYRLLATGVHSYPSVCH